MLLPLLVLSVRLCKIKYVHNVSLEKKFFSFCVPTIVLIQVSDYNVSLLWYKVHHIFFLKNKIEEVQST